MKNTGADMKEKNEKELFLRIDTRHNSLCIHRPTLESIGNPEFIHLGFHPKSKKLMVLGTWIDEKKAIRVKYDRGESFYIYSKSLIDGIRMISGSLKKQGSYLLKGKKAASIPAISFSVAEEETEFDETV